MRKKREIIGKKMRERNVSFESPFVAVARPERERKKKLLLLFPLTVHVVRVGLVRGPVADQRRHLDHRRLVRHGLGRLDRLADRVEVGVAVGDVLRVPAERVKARRDVLGERDVGVAVDGDLVVVVEDDELAEAPVAGEGGGLGGDALHVAACFRFFFFFFFFF